MTGGNKALALTMVSEVVVVSSYRFDPCQTLRLFSMELYLGLAPSSA